MLTITEFNREMIPEASKLFIENFRRQRQAVPALSDRMEDEEIVTASLEKFFSQCPGVAALENGRLVGYLGWYLVDDFRDTGHKAAYCPEWGHGTTQANKPAIYRALYKAAAARWFEAGCHTHTISLLAYDAVARETWFWSGFGLLVVDAVRPITPLGVEISPGLDIRKASLADVETLANLEAEHWRHYPEPPTLMLHSNPDSVEKFAQFLQTPPNSAWLASIAGEPAGYLRFEGVGYGSATILRGPHNIHNTGAFVRPAFRGRGIAPALLDAALRDYARQGITSCSVDFESINPEAAVFWPRYFEPVCLALTRVPERQP